MRFGRQRLSRSPNLEKDADPVADVLTHLENILRREEISRRERKQRVAGMAQDPHQPNDWAFSKPLRLPIKSPPRALNIYSPPLKRKPPPVKVHRANKPVKPHGGWVNTTKKKKKSFTITLPKSSVKLAKGLKRRQEIENKSKKRKPNNFSKEKCGNNVHHETEDESIIMKRKEKKSKSSGKKKLYKGTYQWRRKDDKYVIMKFRQTIAEKDTEKAIAKEWDKFIFEAQNHGRTINTEVFNFSKDIPTRRKRSRTRVYFPEYRAKLDKMTNAQIEQLQEPLNPPKNKRI